MKFSPTTSPRQTYADVPSFSSQITRDIVVGLSWLLCLSLVFVTRVHVMYRQFDEKSTTFCKFFGNLSNFVAVHKKPRCCRGLVWVGARLALRKPKKLLLCVLDNCANQIASVNHFPAGNLDAVQVFRCRVNLHELRDSLYAAPNI